MYTQAWLLQNQKHAKDGQLPKRNEMKLAHIVCNKNKQQIAIDYAAKIPCTVYVKRERAREGEKAR